MSSSYDFLSGIFQILADPSVEEVEK